jgi:transporter family protein
MPLWLILALCCITSWGIWGFLAKLLTAKGMHPVALSAVSSLTTALTAWIAFFFLAGAPWDKTYGHIPFALIVGILGSVGAITFFFALHHGRASLVVPLSALYPAITILLSFFFLGERPTPLQGLGIVLAMLASLLLGL